MSQYPYQNNGLLEIEQSLAYDSQTIGRTQSSSSQSPAQDSSSYRYVDVARFLGIFVNHRYLRGLGELDRNVKRLPVLCRQAQLLHHLAQRLPDLPSQDLLLIQGLALPKHGPTLLKIRIISLVHQKSASTTSWPPRRVSISKGRTHSTRWRATIQG
jgi:hypothetical protein